jgi:hypothetical protein
MSIRASGRAWKAWNTAPGVLRQDEALLAEWHKTHPVKPWRGQDGRGGFIGWANRLDEGVARRGHLMPPRSTVIPVGQGEIYREVLRQLKDWRVLLALVIGVAAAVAIDAAIGLPVVFVVLVSRAGVRVRSRRRRAMRAELAALGDGPNCQ